MKKKILSILLAIVLGIGTFGLVACGGPSGTPGPTPGPDHTTIKFWYYGDLTATNAYEAMVDAYNKGQGVKDGVSVTPSVKPEDGYVTTIQTSMSTKSGPDVFFAWDRYYKEWTSAGMTTNLQPYVDAAEADGTLDLDSIWTSTVDRFRYNKELNLSSPEEDAWGLPIDTSPTALFYNRNAIEAVGVKVISVKAEDLDEWNAGGVEDAYGNTKEELGITVNVPAKGYFRNDNNVYVGGEGAADWVKPAASTLKVFNDQIAMNWDEIEDLGHLMTKKGGINSAAITDYGYYTEWWFNFGWSVGGDCVEDMSGNGSWTYSHGDYSANYIVNEGKTFTGAVTGKVYQAGETLEFLDKLDVAVGDEIASDDKGGYYKGGHYGVDGEYDFDGATLIGGEWNRNITSDQPIRKAVKDAAKDGTLTQLPSIREAFTRFARLAGMEGRDLNICPYPSSFGSGSSSIQYFTDGKLGFIVERGFNIALVDEFVADAFTWAVAPLPVYKKYTEPTDPMCDTVEKQGRIAGHSESTALVIRNKSNKKEASFKFIKWMVGPEAQAIKASYGFIPNQANQAQGFYTKLDPTGKRNLDAFINAAEYETPGDWWYMINKDWIDVWASPLNNQVRYGKMDLDEYFETYIKNGNAEVEAYGNYTDGLGTVKGQSAN